jgi:hypothetical protein
MYELIVYNDLNKKEILYRGVFRKKKDIYIFSKTLIKYTDMNDNIEKKYKTFKDLFEILLIK